MEEGRLGRGPCRSPRCVTIFQKLPEGEGKHFKPVHFTVLYFIYLFLRERARTHMCEVGGGPEGGNLKQTLC